MSDREMWAYAIIVIGGLLYGAAMLRWWYMSPDQIYARRSRRARTKRTDSKGARAGHSAASGEPSDDQ